MNRSLTLLLLAALSLFAHAQGTKLWTVDRFEQLERGTAENVAIASDGRLEPGPATALVATTGGNYLWSLAAGPDGTAYAGTGGATANSATVLRIARDGKPTRIFEGRELAVQALRSTPDGTLFLVTSPDGKLYRIGPNSAAAHPDILFDPSTTPEKPKYLWDLAVGKSGEVYVAAGAPAAVYRIPPGGGPATLLFKTSDQHIRCLLLGPDGTLWAGTDGSGVIYRIPASELHAGSHPFAVYAAPRHEITALALGPDGILYAAGVGAKTLVNLPPLPVTGSVAVSVTFIPPNSSTAASTNTVLPDGSEIYRIAADGTPSRLLALKDDIVYALTLHKGSLLAATGNRGRIYRVDLSTPGRYTDLAHLEAAQSMAFAPMPGGLLVATSNSAKLYRLEDRLAPSATYTSEVFDAGIFSQWGRPEVRSSSAANFDLFLRTGNVESPLSGWSDWVKLSPNQPPTPSQPSAPAARFAQWRAAFRTSSPGPAATSLDSVAINYLARNLPPVVDEVVVQPGARVAPPATAAANATVQISFPAAPAAAPAFLFPTDTSTAALAAQKDRTAVTVRWAAHDDNGDELTFSIWFRGDTEINWHLLKDRIPDRVYSFDSALLPDGIYTLRIVASDAPSHTASEALSGDKNSAVFTIDTTPPVPSPLEAHIGPDRQIHARFDVRDATSPIAHAEYSVDAAPWQYLEPGSRLSDSLSEHYDFIAALTAPNANPATPAPTDPNEHVLAVRVYDRYENMASIKTIVH